MERSRATRFLAASILGAAVANAAKTCKAEQADPNFAAAHGGKTFDQPVNVYFDVTGKVFVLFGNLLAMVAAAAVGGVAWRIR